MSPQRPRFRKFNRPAKGHPSRSATAPAPAPAPGSSPGPDASPVPVSSPVPEPSAPPRPFAPHAHPPDEPRLIATFEKTFTLRIRHHWIYDNMVAETSGALADGETVYIYDRRHKFLGSAIYNSASRIRARIFSLEHRPFDDAYVREAVAAAVRRRRALFPEGDSFRAVYSDADGLPGVVADLIGGILSVQLLTLAADRRADTILAALKDTLSPAATIVHRDLAVRTKEGLPLLEPRIEGTIPEAVPVAQDGFTTFADLRAGQKTGLFLDQRFNRRLIIPFCREAAVLDLFSYVGGWALTAAAAGARDVVAVDSSASAVELGRRGAAENGFPQVRFECVDAFDYLASATARGARFDVVVCDPPAFAKTRKHASDAIKGYLSLNYRCMRLLPPGGILATSSCSHHVTPEEFEEMLETAARNARMQFQIVARGAQAPDHPPLLGFPESEYLKCLVLQRVE